jgi:folylpolyglutamate synthase/dihydropteroate synthase
MKDKDVTAVYRGIGGFASRILFLPLDAKFPRALPFADLERALAESAGPEHHGTLALRPFPLEALALERLLAASGPGSAAEEGFDLAVICGSLYLLGEVIPMLWNRYPQLAWFRQFQGEG